MEVTKFEKAKAIEQEIEKLHQFKRELEKDGITISAGPYYSSWEYVKNAFDKKAWEDNLFNLASAGIAQRIKELDKEFDEL